MRLARLYGQFLVADLYRAVTRKDMPDFFAMMMVLEAERFAGIDEQDLYGRWLVLGKAQE